MDKDQSTELLFDLSQPGRRAARFPAIDVPTTPVDSVFGADDLAEESPPLPELAEIDVVRHFTNLSTRNMSVDTNFYPLGSCTMKYNPKRNERLASLPQFADLHPYQPDATHQGMLRLLFDLEAMIGEISGLDAVCLQPAAGAHGELTALLVAASYFRKSGQARTKVLIPDSAHGTNPSSAHLAGFDCVQVASDQRGLVDMNDLRAKIDGDVAVFMITNPNTIGLFDHQIVEIASLIHEAGGLMYLDGANMNAILGQTRPGDFGIDLMHFNPHKTFSGPHGGGGPGAGPIAVRGMLEPFLPTPRIAERDGQWRLDFDRPDSIGRVRSFFGNTGVLVRAYCYIRTHGAEGLKSVSTNAVLNANYLLSLVKDFLPVPHGDRCMHEFVASASGLHKSRGVRTMDIAKRLLDRGYHAPTVYFPLVVPEAMMIEPTETESKETLEQFADVLREIIEEPAELLQQAPHTLGISRPDEVRAARKPVLRWQAST
ncbi:putative glycine dehydrogenase (decarboxylating) subunit 2 [Planctomycetes bacterium Pan216]|uniref:Probable glycine dehydrogenase (decarboxylating) subunit 2 n=1 Tax=Kolteria novifilia TaxID=2527975 RepID=A0A518BCB9_9BACT|nr:putative glycine dehydrogenase (decarboxylating) subunit 2 [Planctomycetes bacterium Pan216]